MTSKKSFSLIEFILVATILAVISVGVITSLFSGIKVWSRAHELSVGEQKLLLVLEDISRSFRQIKQFDESFIVGDRFAFAYPVFELGEFYYIELMFDKKKTILFRTKKTIKEYFDDSLFSKRKQALISVDDLIFKYLVRSEKIDQEFVWADEYRNEKGELFAVKAIVTVKETEYVRTVFLPVVPK